MTSHATGSIPEATSLQVRLPEDRRTEVSSDEQLLSARDVAALMGVSVKRVYELGIPAIRISQRSLRWRLRDVLGWIEDRRDRR
jgi:predicted DNA-binding transcriptional regulator AlpA